MNFWKNPEYAPLKTVLALVIAIAIGWGIYNVAGNSGSLAGNIFESAKKDSGLTFNVSFDGKVCSISMCEITKGTVSNSCAVVSGTTDTVQGTQTCQIDEKTKVGAAYVKAIGMDKTNTTAVETAGSLQR